jgi:hypothetical protein
MNDAPQSQPRHSTPQGRHPKGKRMRVILLLCVFMQLVDQVPAADEIDYLRDIRPLLATKCGACHGALKQQAGLRLDAGELIRKGGEDGPVIVPGKADESRLMQRVTVADPAERMPPEGEGEPLNAKQLALLAAWINAGATSPDDEVVPEDPRQHWAYQVPQRPTLNLPDDHSRIDAFIARRHQSRGLKSVGLADRHTLLRRVYLDLIGLPPTRVQIEAFMQDQSHRAWPNLVDTLLESPHYGERWGRHWMDVWRYSDWDGYKQQLRGSQRHIWRWRDWIVDSLNADKGYNRMIVEMLAGDEVAPNDPSVLPATGFLARNYHKSNRNIWLDATVEHTAKAFLGMTLNCARCHDHKFDPIPQTAYYQFRSIFEPHNVRTDRIPGKPDIMQDGLPRAFDADLTTETFLYLRGDDRHPDKDNPMTPAVPEILGGSFEPQSVPLPFEVWYPALTEFVVNEQLATARKQLATAEKKLADATVVSTEDSHGDIEKPLDVKRGDVERLELQLSVARLRAESLAARLAADRAKYAQQGSADGDQTMSLAMTAAATERQLQARQSELTVMQKTATVAAAESSDEKNQKKKQTALAKAKKELDDAAKKLKTAQDGLKKTDATYKPLGKEYPKTSSGRRLALARWIASPHNPLTARVAVNHIWMRHFGKPLVDNVFDFGLRSPRPEHADLLDWLAVELMEHDWSMKHLHRLIVNSRTWRLSTSAPSAVAEHNRKLDRDNHLLWRMNVRRLDAEIIRDNVLAVSGQLDPQRGGADIDFRKGEESRRRSIYLRHAYEKQMTMLVLFDAASPNDCYRRSESIIPQQALALANSSLVLSGSRVLARQLWQDVGPQNDDAGPQFVRLAFLQILSRPPAEEEQTACLEFLTEQARSLSDPSKLTTFAGGSIPKVKPATDAHERARENLVHVLMNHNDFVTMR